MSGITKAEYNGRTEDQWMGVSVITLRQLSNGYLVIRPGTICTIDGKRGGFSLKTRPCECCGVMVYMSKVEPGALEVAA